MSVIVERGGQRGGAGGQAALVIVCDLSSSMGGRKFDRLKSELEKLWPDLEGARLVAFSDQARWVDGPAHLPRVGGGTYLADALLLAGRASPPEVLVISDGLPADGARALEVAARLPGTVSVLFVGDDGDLPGQEFMRELARVGAGAYARKDIGKHLEIACEVRGLLALPPPIAMGGTS